MHQENRGLGSTCNRALEFCDTIFFARMDADDIAGSDRLRQQMEFLQRNPRVGMLGTQIEYLVGEKRVPAMDFPEDHGGICRALAARRNPLCHPALIYRTDVANSIGGYHSEGFGEEFDFMVRFAEKSRVANLSSRLYLQRVHETSGTFSSSRIMAQGQTYALYCAGLRRQNLSEPNFAEYLENVASRTGLASRTAEAIEAWAIVQYRRSIIDRAMNRPMRAYTRLALMASVRPKAVLSRLVSG